MATKGISKEQVINARNQLLAQGKAVTIDAVRAQLGMTGSKTTILRYLREIVAEELPVDDQRRPSGRLGLSEALLDLVARLAERLQLEADERISEATDACLTRVREVEVKLDSVARELATAESTLADTRDRLGVEQGAHSRAADELVAARITNEKLRQQVTDLGERLSDNEAHRRSLEEKHVHARQVLEHYRESVKQQRDQDANRHEQQVQGLQMQIRSLNQTVVVKQEEITAAAARLAKLEAEVDGANGKIVDQAAVIARGDRDSQEKQKRIEVLDARIVSLDADRLSAQADLAQLRDQKRVQDQIIQWNGEQVKELESRNVHLLEKLALQEELLAALRMAAASSLAPGARETLKNSKNTDTEK